MVDVAQLVERQVVVLDVVGSSPTIHPILLPQISLKAPIRGPLTRKNYTKRLVWPAPRSSQSEVGLTYKKSNLI